MSGQGEETEESTEALPAAPGGPQKERPLIDLREVLEARRGKGAGLGVPEAILFLDYMDRKEERAYRRDQAEAKATAPSTPSSSPQIERLRTEFDGLKSSVADLVDRLKMREASTAQKDFADEIMKGVKNEVNPTIQALESRLKTIEEGLTVPPAEAATKTSDLAEATHTLRDAIDKLGEKAGAKALNLDDVDKILTIMDKLKVHIPKEASGEFDWRTTGITTAGEVASEFIKAYKEVSTSAAGTGELEPEAATPAKRNIIERQLLLYLQRKMKEGAVTFSPYEAAEEVGATPRQIMLALESLTQKGLWRPPKPSKGDKKHVPPKTEASRREEKIEGVIQEGEIFRPV